MRVIVSAFGLSPYRGSENAIGWNVTKELAWYHDITVIYGDVSGAMEKKSDVDRYLQIHGPVHNLTLEYVAPSRLIALLERLHRIPGCWGLYYLAYNLWHRKAYKHVLELHRKRPFDVAHKLNMLGFREPGYLWKMGIPFVWGPVGGAPNESLAFHKFFSFSGCVKVGLRTLLNEFQKRVLVRPRLAARRAKKIWAITSDDIKMISGIWGHPCEQMLDGGTDASLKGEVRTFASAEQLRIVWSGIHTSRKALPILLEALASGKVKSLLGRIHLDVLGFGPETVGWQKLARKLDVDGCITWHGMLPRSDGIEVMRKGHIFACTSLKEAASIVVMEAISLGMPVICHDACGMGVEVTDACGFKVPLKNPSTSVDGFATAIASIFERPELVSQKSSAALERSKALTWASKAREIARGYEAVR